MSWPVGQFVKNWTLSVQFSYVALYVLLTGPLSYWRSRNKAGRMQSTWVVC